MERYWPCRSLKLAGLQESMRTCVWRMRVVTRSRVFCRRAQEMGRRALHHTDVIMGYRKWFASV